MKRLIDAGLEQVASMLIRMGEIAQNTISLSIMGYIEGIHNLTQVENMSETLSSMADNIEDRIFEIISRFQPVASDLRILKSYMKISYDFRRYGRYAFDVSQICERLGDIKNCKPLFKKIIRDMAEVTFGMVDTSIQSLKSHDIELAKTLSEMEKRVDDMYYTYLEKIIETKISTGPTISSLLVVRYLERIADHATYIGESIIYLATGEKVTIG